MKTMTTAVAVILASMAISACAKKEPVAPAEPVPVVTPAAAEAAPAATSGAESNTEDGSQTSGDKVAPRANDTAAPAG